MINSKSSPLRQNYSAAKDKAVTSFCEISNDFDKDGCIEREIIAGIVWHKEVNGENCLIDERSDVSRMIVNLEKNVEIHLVKEFHNGKAYAISGDLNGKPCNFTLLRDSKGKIKYSVGKGVPADAKGRINSLRNDVSAQIIQRESLKTI